MSIDCLELANLGKVLVDLAPTCWLGPVGHFYEFLFSGSSSLAIFFFFSSWEWVKYKRAGTFQATACVTSANIPPAKESHMAKSTIKTQGSMHNLW